MKLTTTNIILDWLNTNRGKEFPIFRAEFFLPAYGMKKFGVSHTPGTYSRYFRKVKSDIQLLKENNITLEEFTTSNGDKCIRVK